MTKRSRYQICKASIKRYFKAHPWAKTYCGIISRCKNPKQYGFKYYGAQGIRCLITIQDLKALWFRDRAFDMTRPSIDRIDPYGDYEPSNCRYIEFNENLRRPQRKHKFHQVHIPEV